MSFPYLQYPRVKEVVKKGGITTNPLEIGSSLANSKSDSIIFIPKMVKDASAFTAINSLSDIPASVGSLADLGKAIKSLVVATYATIQDLAGSATKQAFENTLKYIIFEYTTSAEPGTGTKAPLIIKMPLRPEMLSSIQHKMTWKSERVAPGQQVQAALNTLQSAASGNIKGTLTNAASFALEKYGKEGIINMLESGDFKLGNVGGAVYTPKKQMFEEVDIMSFNFEWELIPKSFEEANEILNIVNAFRVLAYPMSMGRSGKVNARSVVRQPALWDVRFPQGIPGESFFDDILSKNNKFLCVIDTVDMEIGRPVEGIAKIPKYQNGFPNVIKLKVSMKEYWSVMDAAERFGDAITDKFKNSVSLTDTQLQNLEKNTAITDQLVIDSAKEEQARIERDTTIPPENSAATPNPATGNSYNNGSGSSVTNPSGTAKGASSTAAGNSTLGATTASILKTK